MQTETALRTIGKYEVLGTLGRGSMGVVYKARDPEIGRIVAVKTLRKIVSAQFHDADTLLERFRMEARSAGNLRHPNIITIFEVSRDRDTPFLVMDFVEGESLDSVIHRLAKLEPAYAMHYMAQVAAGLDYAHSKGVIHRDIKPSNILVDKSENVFILDFGVATITEEISQSAAQEPAQNQGPVMGTPGYMSPEQILNEALDHRSDLFSFGIVAYQCLAGKRPFPGETFTAVIGNILNSKPVSITSIVPELPLSLEVETEKALARKREERFNSAQELVLAFSKALGIENPLVKPYGDSKSRKRSRRQSNWKPFWQKKEEEVKPNGVTPPGSPPQQNDQAGAAAAAAWGPVKRFDPDALKNFGRSDNPEATPGSLFSHVTDSLSGSGMLSTNPTVLRSITVILAAIAVLLGVLLLDLMYGSGGPEKGAVENLGNGIGVSVERVRVEAPSGKSIHELGNEELKALLHDPQASEARIIDSLREATQRRLPDLVNASEVPLHSDSYAVRVEALRALASTKDSRAVPLVHPLLEDYDPQVRTEAAKTLGVLGDRKSLSHLSTRLVQENVPDVRTALKAAIEKISGVPVKDK